MILTDVLLLSIACMLFCLCLALLKVIDLLSRILDCGVANDNRKIDRMDLVVRFLRSINIRTFNYYEAVRENRTKGGGFYLPFTACIEGKDSHE